MTAQATVERVTPDDGRFDEVVFAVRAVSRPLWRVGRRGRAWLRATLSAGDLLAFLARTSDASAIGFGLVALCPASLAGYAEFGFRPVTSLRHLTFGLSARP